MKDFKMNGKILHNLLKNKQVNFVELAKKLNLSPQALNSKFKNKEISINFLHEISSAINKNLYFELFETTNTFSEPGEVYRLKKKYIEERIEEIEKQLQIINKKLKL